MHSVAPSWKVYLPTDRLLTSVHVRHNAFFHASYSTVRKIIARTRQDMESRSANNLLGEFACRAYVTDQAMLLSQLVASADVPLPETSLMCHRNGAYTFIFVTSRTFSK